MSTFVTVGNGEQSFGRLLEEIARMAAAGALPGPVLVQHGNTPFSSTYCEAVAFLGRAEFDQMIEQRDLLISHGGATVLQGARAGKVPVVMPRRAKYDEVIDDHQLDFSLALERAGKIVVAQEPKDLASAIEKALRLQRERDQVPAAEPRLISLVRAVLDQWAGESAA